MITLTTATKNDYGVWVVNPPVVFTSALETVKTLVDLSPLQVATIHLELDAPLTTKTELPIPVMLWSFIWHDQGMGRGYFIENNNNIKYFATAEGVLDWLANHCKKDFISGIFQDKLNHFRIIRILPIPFVDTATSVLTLRY